MVVGNITKTDSPAFLPSASPAAQDRVSHFAASILPKVGRSLKIIAYIAGAVIVISLVIKIVRVFQKQKLHKNNYTPIADRKVVLVNVHDKGNIEDLLKRLPNCDQIKNIFYHGDIHKPDNIYTPFSSCDGKFATAAISDLNIFQNPEQILILYSSGEKESEGPVKGAVQHIPTFLLEDSSCIKEAIETWTTKNKKDYEIAYASLTYEENGDLQNGYIPERLFNMCKENKFQTIAIKNPQKKL